MLPLTLKELKPKKMSIHPKHGYWQIALSHGHSQTQNKYLHRLLAETFVDGYFSGAVVNHNDGNKLNNELSNLIWVTSSENNSHAYRTGLKTNAHSNHPDRLSHEEVRWVRDQRGVTGSRTLAKKIGLCRESIQDIWHRRTYQWVPEQGERNASDSNHNVPSSDSK